MDLSHAGKPLSYEIAFLHAAFTAGDSPVASKGDACTELVLKTQALAIIVLLARGDSDGFHHNLIRSALWRRSFLEMLRDAAVNDAYHQCASRIQGIHGALAARDFDTALNIVRLTPTDFRKQMEYEDDYCIARLTHHLLVNDLAEDEVANLIARYAELDDEEAPRLRVLRAILDADSVAFGAAFADLIDARAMAIEADRERGQLEDAEVLAHRYVYIEGLALLNLAERHGIMIDDEYRFCPPAARAPMQRPFPGG